MTPRFPSWARVLAATARGRAGHVDQQGGISPIYQYHTLKAEKIHIGELK